jgi:hypothetical protein
MADLILLSLFRLRDVRAGWREEVRSAFANLTLGYARMSLTDTAGEEDEGFEVAAPATRCPEMPSVRGVEEGFLVGGKGVGVPMGGPGVGQEDVAEATVAGRNQGANANGSLCAAPSTP